MNGKLTIIPFQKIQKIEIDPTPNSAGYSCHSKY